MRKTKIMSLLLVIGLSLSLVGCGETTTKKTGNSSKIELIDPVSAEASTDVVTTRTMYDVVTYSGSVFPYIEEYSSLNGMTFKQYGAYPGNEVKAGQELILSDTKNADERIKNMNESILEMDQSYAEYLEDYKEQYEELLKAQDMWKQYVDLNLKQKPAESSADYADWKVGYDYVEACYKQASYNLMIAQTQKEQKETLYKMDRAYSVHQLEVLKKNRAQESISTNMDGVVVATNLYDSGDYINKDTNVIAVGDLNQKIFKCDYIAKTTLMKAKDYYVYINGKRYEAIYDVMEADEYVRLSAQNEKVYTTFTLVDAEDVNIGDFAVLAIVKDVRENVVSIPKAALRKDDSGYYVYVVRNGENVYTSVKTDFSDGVYTEIVSGLTPGDEILYNGEKMTGTNTVKVEKGELSTDFSQRATMLYPATVSLTNPIENGTTYFGEMQVHQYQHVEKGDVICTVRVVADQLSLTRNENKKTRLVERIGDWEEKAKKEEDEETYKDLLEGLYEQLKDIEETIAKQKSDFATKEIKASCSGLITYLREFNAEDVVNYNEFLCSIADESECYIATQDEKGVLQYGNTVSVAYKDNEKNDYSVTGTVVSMSAVGISSSISTEYTLVQIDKEKLSEAVQRANENGEWWNPYKYTVKCSARSMGNCLVVPRSAVKMTNEKAYVYVKNADGTIVANNVVVGGYNNSKYWILEGVTEGMELCLD